MRIDPRTGFPVLEFTEDEHALDRLEESWADCAGAFRSGWRQVRRGGRLGYRCLSLLQVHELLEDWRKDYEQGNVSALYSVLKQCLEENLPLPYWAADGLLKAMRRVNDEHGLSLHTALGLDERYPLTEKKARTARRDWRVAVEMWGLVRLHQKEHRSSLNAAICAVRKVRPDIAAAIGQRKAYDAFKMVDRIQSRAINTLHKAR